MKSKRIYTLLVLIPVLLVLAVCSSGNAKVSKMEPDTFSNQDMAIYKVDNSRERVSYGMSRKNAEKVLGTGNEGISNWYTYDSGVSVIYRHDKAVAITLERESQGAYKTARGAEVGTNKERIKELYGEKYAIENASESMKSLKYLEYYYDTETKKLVKENTSDFKSLSKKELRAKYLLSTTYNEDGKIGLIILTDAQATNTFE
ncbi:hypothetical protein MHH60_25485 [Paenibacillus sp. FSL H7-0716]|uniref:Uncharacterized protein n=1 Tax=Paenibacillus odorifer TaxID=189426 RepID=A0AB36JCN4_9BACL|nr:hypothetical protein [Paenibacillus odorifer]OME19113.1 hypothetical protein BSK47_16175 [Paenibacillus odorifer]